MKWSAVSIVPRHDGKLLVVWNEKHQGWVLPGGKVEDNELVTDAQRRELKEETSLETLFAVQVFSGPSAVDEERQVVAFLVWAYGSPREVEEGKPYAWMTLDELLTQSPFRAYYEAMIAVLEVRHTQMMLGAA